MDTNKKNGSMNNKRLHNDLKSLLGEENISQEDLNFYGDIMELSQNLVVPEASDKKQALKTVNDKIKMQQHAKNKKIKFSILVSVAAGILLILGLYVLLVSGSKSFNTGNKQTQLVYLPDGSEVMLNAQSYLAYNDKNWAEKRTVTLKGEAFFKVKKGSKFSVMTEAGTVEVLGTSFNVNDRDGLFEVSCFTGKVKVCAFKDCKTIIRGQGVRTNSHKLEVFKFDKEKTATWRNGEFYFDNKPLSYVFHEIERQFDVEIKTPDLTGMIYTGFFTNKNIKEALDNVCVPMGLDYKLVDHNTILIFK